MGEGSCKGTKGQKIDFLRKKHFNPQNLNAYAKPKKLVPHNPYG